MPRVEIPQLIPTRSGTVFSATGLAGDATNNHYTANNGRTLIFAHNTGVGARTITFVVKRQVDSDIASTNRIDSIPAGERQFYRLDPAVYGSVLDINVEHAEVKLWAISGE